LEVQHADWHKLSV